MCQYNPHCSIRKHHRGSASETKCKVGGSSVSTTITETFALATNPNIYEMTDAELANTRKALEDGKLSYWEANKDRCYDGPQDYKNFNVEVYRDIKEKISEFDLKIREIRVEQWERNPLPEYESNFVGFGLEEARLAVLTDLNNLGQEPFFTEDIESNITETLERIQSGEVMETQDTTLVMDEDRLLYCVQEPDSSIASNNTAVILMEFSDKYLAPVLNRLEVSQVSVSPLINGRELGLVYTVMQPDGDSRSFAIYEHRNTDSIVINGATNWDVEETPYGPYTGGSSWDFFAEFSSGEFKQSAETLGYFMKSAISGELESDAELIEKAEHIDWNAILDEQIPAFKEWRKEQGIPDKKGHFDIDLD